MYCINCGVKLAETEKKCPLCNTVVCHPDFKQEPQQTLYPNNKMPKTTSGLKALGGVIIILFLIPLIIGFVSDIQHNGKLDWFGYVAGALAVSYVIFALPLWFKKPNPVIFVPCGFVAVILYLLYINFATNNNWFFSFAFPVVGGLCLIITTIITLMRYVKKGMLYIFGGASILLGGLILLVEYLLKLTFSISFIGWSIYPLIILVILGCLLIYLGINRNAREVIKRKLFF